MILRRIDRLAVGDVVKHGPEVSWTVTAISPGDTVDTVAIHLKSRFHGHINFAIVVRADDLIEVVK
jgi:hypothetical protein